MVKIKEIIIITIIIPSLREMKIIYEKQTVMIIM